MEMTQPCRSVCFILDATEILQRSSLSWWWQVRDADWSIVSHWSAELPTSVSGCTQTLLLYRPNFVWFDGRSVWGTDWDKEELIWVGRKYFSGEPIAPRWFTEQLLVAKDRVGLSLHWCTAAEKMGGKLQPEHSQPPACLLYRDFKLFSFHFPNVWCSLQFHVQMKCVSLIGS